MWPLLARISEESLTASAKSPVISVRAARKRLPKLCPLSWPSPLKRGRKSFDKRCESSERATMQLRMSPGGSICSSSRSRPELPPSSETVTMAESDSSQRQPRPSDPTSCLRPERRVERPVPPPSATRLRPRSVPVCKVVLLLLGTSHRSRDGVTESYPKGLAFQS